MKDISSLSGLTALVIAVALAIAGFAAISPRLAGAEGSNVPPPAEPERYGVEDRWEERLSDQPPIFGALRELPEDENGDGTLRSEDGTGNTRQTEYAAAEGTSSEERSDPADGTVSAVRIYIVQSGDNLTYIAEAQYGIADDRAAYLEALVIWGANLEVIGPDPDLILTGQALDLPIDGQPPAQPEGADTPLPISEAGEAAPAEGIDSGSVTGVSGSDGAAAGVVAGESDNEPGILSSPLFFVCLVLAAAIAGLFLLERRPRARNASASQSSVSAEEEFRRHVSLSATEAGGSGSSIVAVGERTAGPTERDAYGTPIAGSAGSAGKTRPLALVAVDDIAEASFLARGLAGEGLAIVAIANNADIFSDFQISLADIVLVDQSANQFCALSALEKLRRSTSVPIILLLHSASPRDRIRALQMGADDCLSKPVGVCEVAARINAVLRRSNSGQKLHQTIQVHDLEVDLIHQTARQNGNYIKLTPTEWQLLRYLVLNGDRIITKDEILTAVWGREYNDADAYLRVWIPRLRKKLEGTRAAELIKTVNGMGYLMDLRQGRREDFL